MLLQAEKHLELTAATQFSSVSQSCLTLCNSMDCSAPGFLVHHQFPAPAQTHVLELVMPPSHPLSSPSTPAFNLSQEAGQVVWYSHLSKNFPQFVVIHTVKGFGIVNEAEVFLELSCFLDDPADVGNLISCSSAFSKSSLNYTRIILSFYLPNSSYISFLCFVLCFYTVCGKSTVEIIRWHLGIKSLWNLQQCAN